MPAIDHASRPTRKSVDVRERLLHYNRMRIGAAVGYAIGTPILWFLSYWLVWWIAASIMVTWGIGRVAYAHWIAGAAMVLLLVEGMRSTRSLWDLSDYAGSVLSADAPLTGAAHVAGVIARPLTLAYAISQFLYCAPRTMVLAYRNARLRLHLSDTQIATAQSIFNELQRSGKWADLETYLEHRNELTALQRMQLIWIKENQGKMQVRADPSYT